MSVFNKKNFIYFLSFLFNEWLMVSSETEFNLIYSSIFVLLDKTIVDVAKDGIHFFNDQLNIEDNSHFVNFTDPLGGVNDLYKISIAQFSGQYDDEYLLILCRRIIYIFDKQHNLTSNFSLDETIPDYSNIVKYIIPYKKLNESLHYLIRYSDYSSHHILHYKFNLSSLNVENISNDTIIINDGINPNSVYCSFMTPLPSTDIDHYILNCFYVSSNTNKKYMNSVSYDPERNFNEIGLLRYNITFDFWQGDGIFFEGIINEEKDKVLFYFRQNICYWGTFDYRNLFSDFVPANGQNPMQYSYYGHKLFYFRDTKEFIVMSSLGEKCQRFIMVFHSNLTINYKGILDFGQCQEIFGHNMFYNGNNYMIIYEDKRMRSNEYAYGAGIISINELNFTSAKPSITSTIPYNQETNIITDKITTTEPTIITTEPTIITTELTIITNEPTIITTESTIITNEPTIITNEPKIITDEPTIITTELTIITTEPTIITTELTIITNEPTIITTELTIITTEPTIITTELTIITNEPTIITTELTIITNEPTIITDEPTFITNKPEIITDEPIISTFEPTMNILKSTNIIEETDNIKNYTQNIKCKTSNYQSYIYDLCLECNKDKDYFPAEYPDDTFLHGFTECYNNSTKPINFYFDDKNKKFKPCYETCLTCNRGGNSEIHNCLSCDANLREEPDKNSTNCITECSYYYYYSPYGQYKCTNSSICPDEANLYIKDLKKCTNDCSKEKSEYKYQYGGQCLKDCPSGTSHNSKGICIIENLDSCSKSERGIGLKEFLTNGGIDTSAKNYANEFNYTKKHVSYLYNKIYSIYLYKDSTCINELSLNIPKVDFGNCYMKVQQHLDPPSNDSIIIALIEKANDPQKSSISYFFYHPGTGKRLDAETICKDEEVTIKKSVLSQLNNSNVDLNSVLFLAQQDINIFNLSDEFYTDICYNYVSPNGKDVPLSDRIKAFYPNITLCESGCICKGVDLDSLESICECKFNDLMRNEYIEDNVLLSNTIGEVFDLIRSSNFIILKCYKGIFKKENIVKSYGGFIIIGIVFFQLIFSLVFGFYDMNMIRKFLHNITEYFMALVTNAHTHRNLTPSKTKGNSKKHAPPKRRQEKEVDKKKKNKRNNIKRNSCISSGYKRKKISKRSIFLDEDYSKGLSSNLRKTESKQLLSSKLSSARKSQKLLRKQKSLQLYRKQSDINSKKLLRAKTLCGNMDIEEYLKPDLDDLEYDDAIKFDKRTFCEFFSERLLEKQIIMNTFYHKENLKPKSIKIILFLLNIDLYFVINGFFYNEEYLSKLFNSNEEETFFSYITRSFNNFVYATLVGVIIGIIIDCIFIEESKVKRIFLREKGNPVQLRYEISITTKSIKKRYIIFIILCFFISIISWYYVSCFNHVYPGVKMEWIKSSITIIIIMQILSILVVLLEAIVRDLSFHYQSEKLFKFKQFLS